MWHEQHAIELHPRRFQDESADATHSMLQELISRGVAGAGVASCDGGGGAAADVAAEEGEITCLQDVFGSQPRAKVGGCCLLTLFKNMTSNDLAKNRKCLHFAWFESEHI